MKRTVPLFICMLLLSLTSSAAPPANSISVEATLHRQSETAFVFKAKVTDLATGEVLSEPKIIVTPNVGAETTRDHGDATTKVSAKVVDDKGSLTYTVEVSRAGTLVATQTATITVR